MFYATTGLWLEKVRYGSLPILRIAIQSEATVGEKSKKAAGAAVKAKKAERKRTMITVDGDTVIPR
jgi:hypothetical protein